ESLLVVRRKRLCVYFFFQAEDGIRDFHVTGVQTCALPISVQIHLDVKARRSVAMHWGTFVLTDEPMDEPPAQLRAALATRALDRSEERRVGKERRSAGSTGHDTQKTCERAFSGKTHTSAQS